MWGLSQSRRLTVWAVCPCATVRGGLITLPIGVWQGLIDRFSHLRTFFEWGRGDFDAWLYWVYCHLAFLIPTLSRFVL
jgi:hypothetical protein